MVVALHGCRQDAEDFANGTRFDVLGERYGALVLYPEQDERVNGHRCWNWFLPQNQRRDGPEPAQILQLVERIAQEHRVDRRRMYVAGLSAGASMAAVLAEQAADVFAGFAAMSGVALHAAHDPESAYAAMRGQPPKNLTLPRLREKVFYRRGSAIIWTGTRDLRVAPVNAWRLAAQFAQLYGLRGAPDEEDSGAGGRHARWHDHSGRTRIEVRELASVGHAWSGGSLRGSYTAPAGPSFSEALFRFFLEDEAVDTKDSIRQCV